MQTKNDRVVREGLPDLMPRLWRYGMVLTRNSDEAAELAQATAVRALERSDQFQPGTRLDRWCFTILASIWKNELRSRSVRRGEGLVPVEDAGLADTAPHADVNISARQVLSGMMQLPEAPRETMFLVYVEGYTYAEAAERLSIPVGTVMSRLANARRRLNETMGSD
ncbi:MAG: sigma-70 family RNA polymerase sigma factor [Pseudomonadota bacterium]